MITTLRAKLNHKKKTWPLFEIHWSCSHPLSQHSTPNPKNSLSFCTNIPALKHANTLDSTANLIRSQIIIRRFSWVVFKSSIVYASLVNSTENMDTFVYTCLTLPTILKFYWSGNSCISFIVNLWNIIP